MSKARNKRNLERYLQKKRLYVRGVSTPNKANKETQKKIQYHFKMKTRPFHKF